MRKIWSILILIVGLSVFAVPGAAKAQDDEVTKQLMMATVYAGVGAACGDRQNQIDASADAILSKLAAAYPDLAARFTHADMVDLINEWATDAPEELKATGGKFFDKPCSYWISMFDILVAGNLPLFEPSDTAETSQKPSEEPFDLGTLKKQLADNIDSLPTGAIPELAGCWDGSSEGSQVELCLSHNADQADIVITGPGQQTCSLNDGVARRRGEGLFFYAFSSTEQCSDGTQVQHIEGYCTKDGNDLSCVATLYSTGNYVLTFPEHDAIMGDNTTLHRKAS